MLVPSLVCCIVWSECSEKILGTVVILPLIRIGYL